MKVSLFCLWLNLRLEPFSRCERVLHRMVSSTGAEDSVLRSDVDVLPTDQTRLPSFHWKSWQHVWEHSFRSRRGNIDDVYVKARGGNAVMCYRRQSLVALWFRWTQSRHASWCRTLRPKSTKASSTVCNRSLERKEWGVYTRYCSYFRYSQRSIWSLLS